VREFNGKHRVRGVRILALQEQAARRPINSEIAWPVEVEERQYPERKERRAAKERDPRNGIGESAQYLARKRSVLLCN
jgi:hypothetical protein